MKMFKILIWGSIFNIIFSLADTIGWSTFLLEHVGVIDVLNNWELTATLRVLYLNNANVARRYSIGRVHSELPNETYIQIYQTSESSLRTVSLAYYKLAYAVLSIQVSLFILSARTTEPGERNEVMCGILTGRSFRRTQNNTVMYIWSVITLIGFFVDFMLTFIYINDLRYASDLVSLVKFIKGVLTGAGRANPDTHMVVWTMVLFVSKCGLGLIVNLFMVLATVTYCCSEHLISVNNTPSTTDSDSSMDQEIEMRQTFPPPHVPIRRGPRFVKRTPEQNRALLNLHHPDIYPAKEIPSTSVLVNELPHPGTGKYSVNFPESLMSISQRIDKILKHEHVSSPIPAGMTKKTPHKQTISPVMSIESGEDEHVIQIEEVLPSRKAKELNRQMPWSYIPPLVNHMRDQLPDDEELPPVPVPDYIVHPSYRKASVHRAQSSLSRELQAKLTIMQNQNKSLKEKHKALRVHRNRISA